MQTPSPKARREKRPPPARRQSPERSGRGAPTKEVDPVKVREVFQQMLSGEFFRRWQQQWKDLGTPVPAKGKRRRKHRSGAERGPRGFYDRIFSLQVTLWYLLFQWLQEDGSQAAVMRDVRRGGADHLSPGRGRRSKKLRSNDASTFNKARQRLPLELVREALRELGRAVGCLVGWGSEPSQPPGPWERRRQLIDGSTIAMLRTPALAEAYPPARNQRGESDWCLMRVVLGFCARSGAIVQAVEGALSHSEQALSWGLLAAGSAWTVWIGDRNFGVWSVVAAAAHHRQDVVVRLTKARAQKLVGREPCPSGQQWAVEWSATRHDQVPSGVDAHKAVSGRVIYVRLQKEGRFVDLWLFTTLTDVRLYPVALLVQWYGQRWQAELHFRSVKTLLGLEELDVRTPAMARKEFYAGLLAYSLVRVVMWAAGERLEQGVSQLSFKQVQRVVRDGLQDWGRGVGVGAGTLRQWVQEMVEEAVRCRLPKRKKPRPTEVRRVRHRRLKFPALIGSRAAARAAMHRQAEQHAKSP